MKLLNKIHTNFIFVPPTLISYRPIKKVIAPVFADKHSLQKLEAIRYLHKILNFELTLCTYDSDDEALKETLFIASKILSNAKIPFTLKYVGRSEHQFYNMIDDFAYDLKADMISIVNLTEANIINQSSKSFVDNLIRNEHSIPILTIQDQTLGTHFSLDHN